MKVNVFPVALYKSFKSLNIKKIITLVQFKKDFERPFAGAMEITLFNLLKIKYYYNKLQAYTYIHVHSICT